MAKGTSKKHSLPEVKLEKGEKVELSIHRAGIGIFFIWFLSALGYVAILLILAFLSIASNSVNSSLMLDEMAKAYIWMVSIVLSGIITIAALVSTKVYSDNHLYVTNKRLIHHECISLFTKSINVIDLSSIEDVSFKQENVIDQIFKLGTIRMSTVGDETTYTFKYVNTPHDELETITHLVHVEKERVRGVKSSDVEDTSESKDAELDNDSESESDSDSDKDSVETTE